jgi:type IV pilus assembly protein PilM
MAVATTGPRLIQYLIQALPVAAEAQTVDQVGWLQSALQAVGANEVHLLVHGPEVVVRRLLLPLMPAKERAEAVKWQLKDEVSFPVEQAIVDVQVVGEAWDKDVKKHDVLAAITSTNTVRQAMTLVERAGARVVSITPSSLAVCACAAQLVPEASTTGSVAVIVIGASQTQVALLQNGRVRITREVSVGSSHLTSALVGVVTGEQGEIAIDHFAAEALKRRYGVLGDAEEGHTEEGVPLFQLSSLMRPVLEQLLTELSRLFDFYRMQVQEAGVTRVLLCGGGALLKGLPAFLAEGLGVPVEVMNPLMRLSDRAITLEPEQVAQDGPRLAAVLGAALEHGQGLVLLPTEARRGCEGAGGSRAWQVGARVIAGVVLAAAIALQAMAMGAQARLRAKEAAWAQMEPLAQRYTLAITRAAQLDATSHHVDAFFNQQPAWAGLLKELGVVTPPTIQLDEAAFNRDDAAPVGYRFVVRASLVGEGSQQGSIAQWIDELERSRLFSQVQLASSDMRSDEAGQTQVEVEGLLE